MRRYLGRFRGQYPVPRLPDLRHVGWSWLGGTLAIALIAGIASAANAPLMIPPFGATAVLALGVHESPLAQPRNIIGGHMVTGVIGVGALMLLGDGWWVMALAVGTAIAAMQLTRTVHPPAGANPVLIMLSGADWWFLLMPLLAGASAMVVVAVIFNKLVPGRRYPSYWL